MPYTFEEMSATHRQPVIDIFNYFIRHTFAAYLDQVVDYNFFDQFLRMARGYPALVIKAEDQGVVGFGFLRPFHTADTFHRAAEVTYFILPEHTRRGLGAALLARFSQHARNLGIDSLLASVSSLNQASLDFHRKQGFRPCGRFRKVGRKFGADFDAVWLQKRI